MTISRDVIIDLLPLYLADEVSDDTRALVETHLASDVQLAKMVEKMKQFDSAESPTYPTPSHESRTFSRAKQLRYRYNSFFLLGTLFTLIWLGFVFLTTSSEMGTGTPGPEAGFAGEGYVGLFLLLLAVSFWIAMANVGRAMSAPPDDESR